MTTPHERTKSVIETRSFLQMLASADEITIRGLIQSVAGCLLRHYPLNVDLEVSAVALPGVWATLENDAAPPQSRSESASNSERSNEMDLSDVPEGFPRDLTPATVPGTQPKLGVVLSAGVSVAGQTDMARYERWLICEDLANQLVHLARPGASSYPQHSPHQTLERVQVSVVRKVCVTPDELVWLMRRLQALLGWKQQIL